MNQTRITLHVCADEREVAARMAVRAVWTAMYHGNGHSSGQTADGSWRCDIEVITVPDDDSESPQYATPMPCPGCKKLCGRDGKCVNTGCAFGPDDEEVIPPVDTRVSTR